MKTNQLSNAVLMSLKDNPHYLRLIRSNRTYYESNGLIWGRLALGLMVGLVIFTHIPFLVYLVLPVLLLIFGLVYSLETVRFIQWDKHQIPYQLSSLTPLDPHNIVEGYFAVSRQRFPLLLGFPARYDAWVKRGIITIYIISYGKALYRITATFQLDNTVTWLMIFVTLGWLASIFSVFAFYDVFSALAVRRGLQAEDNYHGMIGTLWDGFLAVLAYTWTVLSFTLAYVVAIHIFSTSINGGVFNYFNDISLILYLIIVLGLFKLMTIVPVKMAQQINQKTIIRLRYTERGLVPDALL